MLKKARLLTRPALARRDAPYPKQGRSERRGEEVRTALRVGRSTLQWVLANGKAPTAFRTSKKLLLNVEPLSERERRLVKGASWRTGVGRVRTETFSASSGSLSDIAVRDEAKEVRPDGRPQARKNRRPICRNTLRIFSGRERRRRSRIARRSRTVNVEQAPYYSSSNNILK